MPFQIGVVRKLNSFKITKMRQRPMGLGLLVSLSFVQIDANPGVTNQVINLLITANKSCTVVQELMAEPGKRFRFFTNTQKMAILALLPTLYCDKFAVSFFFATYNASKYENRYQSGCNRIHFISMTSLV